MHSMWLAKENVKQKVYLNGACLSKKKPTSINWECTHRQLEGKAAAADLTPWISTHWPLHVGAPPKEVRKSLWISQGKW